eukprot:TRINITY_DN843_c0_g1_i2.p1 TRINITY_DN843_c0_g1~~TRINITY_DN843_c0_g1_i2.p1  ORF type:complete len:526 (+),score=107.68 TRINITY_DN843_c0_g1_i2:132-1709(+)
MKVGVCLVLVVLVLQVLVFSCDGLFHSSRRLSPFNRHRTVQKHVVADNAPPTKTYFFDQFVDHFNYQTNQPNTSTALTYKQRYIVIDSFWGKALDGADPFPKDKRRKEAASCPGPIFFYTGNESPVTEYVGASGFITEVIAPKLGGLVIFAEHRYFGESLPFGADSFEPSNIGYLSTDQALADYAHLIRYLKTTQFPNAENCPVFSFGGSYGGMLTTWFRMKYSHVTMGGLAGSAPFAFPGTGVSPDAFTIAASNTFEQAAPGCGSALKDAINQLEQLTQTQQGRNTIVEKFNLCSQPYLSYSDAVAVLDWVVNGLQDECMLDYPYPTNYGIPIVGWPVNQTCERLLHSYPSDPVGGLAAGIGTFYNGTGSWNCYNITADNPAWGVGPAWPYLACTELYLPSASGGIFPPSPYNETADIVSCAEQFGVQLRPYWPIEHWGGFELSGGSNIIFSNGLLDPWHTSGILKNMSDSLVAIVIPEAAHHLDLRGPNPNDPIYVQVARLQEEQLIVPVSYTHLTLPTTPYV